MEIFENSDNQFVFLGQIFFTIEGNITAQELNDLESLCIEQFCRNGLLGLELPRVIINGKRIVNHSDAKTIYEFTDGRLNGPGVLLNAKDYTNLSRNCPLPVLRELLRMNAYPQRTELGDTELICIAEDLFGNEISIGKITQKSALKAHNPRVKVETYRDLFVDEIH
jgi:hypothetical protein